MFKKKTLDAVEIKSPCGESWNEMQGGEKVRFCSHCAKSVNNISALTRKEAYRLIRESNGSLCVQYIKDPATNKPLYLNDLHQITRRAPALAAGVVAASIGFSASAYAQAPSPSPAEDQPVVEKIETPDDGLSVENETGAIAGKVIGPNGEPLSSVTVTITDEDSAEISQVITDENGNYKFDNLTGKKYRVSVAAAGFIEKELSGISVTEKGALEKDIALELAGIQTVISQTLVEALQQGEAVTVMGGAMIVSVPEYDNALSRAVQDEDIDKVKSLIYRGARINAKEKEYENITALFIAVETGNKSITELLLRFGAKVNVRNSTKQTPIMMLDDDADEGLVALLVQYGASIDLTDEDGNTALIAAAKRSDVKAVKALLVAGADVNVVGEDGKTALIMAAYNDELEIVRALLLAGADVNIKDKENETAWDHTSNAEVEDLIESYGGVSGDPDLVDDRNDPVPALAPVDTDN